MTFSALVSDFFSAASSSSTSSSSPSSSSSSSSSYSFSIPGLPEVHAEAPEEKEEGEGDGDGEEGGEGEEKEDEGEGEGAGEEEEEEEEEPEDIKPKLEEGGSFFLFSFHLSVESSDLHLVWFGVDWIEIAIQLNSTRQIDRDVSSPRASRDGIYELQAKASEPKT
jgi:hypothetical protein